MNHIIIKIESGVVGDVYFTDPVNVTIVDHDVIEGGNVRRPHEKGGSGNDSGTACRARGYRETVKMLVREWSRPADRRMPALLRSA